MSKRAVKTKFHKNSRRLSFLAATRITNEHHMGVIKHWLIFQTAAVHISGGSTPQLSLITVLQKPAIRSGTGSIFSVSQKLLWLIVC